MKNKATDFIKHVITMLGAIAKAKSTAIKSKTSMFKTRLVMLSLMKNKRVLVDSLSHKIHRILGHDDDDDDGQKESVQVNHLDKTIVLNGRCSEQRFIMDGQDEEEDDCKYPDLTHSLFQEEDDDDDDQFDYMQGGRSVIEMMKNNFKEEGEDFKLEDEIDQAADLFIMRFRKQIRMQKLESFKRQKEMQERNA